MQWISLIDIVLLVVIVVFVSNLGRLAGSARR